MTLAPERLSRLSELGRTLVAELDDEALARRTLDAARELTGAGWAALTVVGRDGEATAREVVDGEPPPQDGGARLEVPVSDGGEVLGTLCVTAGGPFTDEDEETVRELAGWAGVALANARRHRAVRGRHDDLARAVNALEATTRLAHVAAGETDLEAVLQLVAERAVALLDAATAFVGRVEGEDVVVAAAAGREADAVLGRRLTMLRALVGSHLVTGRIDDLSSLPATTLSHALEARAVIYTPLAFRGRTLGVVVVYGDAPFGAADERTLSAFAASAATAVATLESAERRALRLSIEAAERERGHWARELHDQTLQELGALRMLLASARRADAAVMAAAVDDAIELIAEAIRELRALITELRPAALDQLGTQAALEALAERTRLAGDLEIDLAVDLAFEQGRAAERHVEELEQAVYRIVQEALTNAVRHAGATRVAVEVAEAEWTVRVDVRDDGRGFFTDGTAPGFGLVGMQERAALVGGRLVVESAPDRGTRVHAELPVRRRART